MATYARVRRLTNQRDKDIGQTFLSLVELLKKSRITGTLRCTILVDDKSRSWTFELRGRDCRLHRDAATVPDLEIITREATWWEIADGRLSPLDAFTQGQMRILGDTALGSRLLRHVAESGGATSICGG